MTLPLGSGQTRSDYVRKRNNWLGKYLAVERGMDEQVYAALKDAMVAVDGSLVALVGEETKSAATRRLQLALTHKEIRSHMTDLFGNVEGTLKEYHGKAAVAAVDAALDDEKRLLSKIFKDKVAAEQYATSLRASANRNIESVMTRVLETKQPLSKRVYKTRALSTGLVDRAINNGIARGDSYTKIANDVKSLIDPDVPGGVTYAAKRLARTETNNAFHAQAIHDAQDKPWTQQMRWNLSKVHQPDDGDPCEEYARQGVFPVEKVPGKPHPHCRCFVTPEPVDDDVFDHAVMSGQYDNYLDSWLDGGTNSVPTPQPAPKVKGRRKAKAPTMVPSPKEKATTKAFQPDAWTGPPVAKPAANATVREQINKVYRANASDVDFQQKVREGARNIEVKGYKGGLSSPGKKAILELDVSDTVPDSVAFDIGRETAARIAHAEASTESVYKSMQLTAKQVDNLYNKPGVSIPLSTFRLSVGEAINYEEAATRGTQVVFEVKPGARVAHMGGSARATMGHFQVTDIVERTGPQGDKYLIARIKQGDPREFEADYPKGTYIPNVEFVDEAPNTGKPSGPTTTTTAKAPAKKAVKKTPAARKKYLHEREAIKAKFTEKVTAAKTHTEVEELFKVKYPYIKTKGFDAQHTTLGTLQKVLVRFDELQSEHKIESLEAIEFSDEVGDAYAHVAPRYATRDEMAFGPDNGSEFRSTLRFSPKFARDEGLMDDSMRESDGTGWLAPNGFRADDLWRTTVTHEFAHVIDFDTGMEMRSALLQPLFSYAQHNFNVNTIQKFRKWIAGNPKARTTYIDGVLRNVWDGPAPSQYPVTSKIDSSSGFNHAEMIAESFTDVENNGEKAKEVSHIVVRIMKDIIQNWDDARNGRFQ